MSEERLLRDAAGREPVTPARLAAELGELGLRRGAIAIVHTSLSRIGWVPGGAQGVIAALLQDFPGKRSGTEGAPMLVDGERHWVRFTETLPDDDDFDELGRDFARDTGQERRGPLGWGEGRLMRVRAIVDYAERWIATHRTA